VARGPVRAGMRRVGSAATGWARRQIRRHPPLFRVADGILRRCGRIA
jgi:hypothetical protein